MTIHVYAVNNICHNSLHCHLLSTKNKLNWRLQYKSVCKFAHFHNSGDKHYDKQVGECQ